MKTSAEQATHTALAALWAPCAVIAIFFLPSWVASPWKETALMVASSGLLTAQVLLSPDIFRSRRGSLKPAICLASALWAMTGVVAILAVVPRR